MAKLAAQFPKLETLFSPCQWAIGGAWPAIVIGRGHDIGRQRRTDRQAAHDTSSSTCSPRNYRKLSSAQTPFLNTLLCLIANFLGIFALKYTHTYTYTQAMTNCIHEYKWDLKIEHWLHKALCFAERARSFPPPLAHSTTSILTRGEPLHYITSRAVTGPRPWPTQPRIREQYSGDIPRQYSSTLHKSPVYLAQQKSPQIV